MSASNAAETAFLDLLFLNIAFANIGNAGGLLPSSVAGSFYVSLHTSDPGETGDQSTNQASYSGYTRAQIVRTGAGFSRSGSVVTNVGTLSFGANGGSLQTMTHFGVGTASTGAGVLICSGALNTPLAVISGMTPQALPGTLAITFD
jgi:hypothetical protein